MRGDIPPSGPWKPPIRPRLVHLNPNTNKKRRAIPEATTPASSTSSDNALASKGRVFGPSDREAAKQRWVAKIKASKTTGTYSSGSGETPYVPSSPGSS